MSIPITNASSCTWSDHLKAYISCPTQTTATMSSSASQYTANPNENIVAPLNTLDTGESVTAPNCASDTDTTGIEELTINTSIDTAPVVTNVELIQVLTSTNNDNLGTPNVIDIDASGWTCVKAVDIRGDEDVHFTNLPSSVTQVVLGYDSPDHGVHLTYAPGQTPTGLTIGTVLNGKITLPDTSLNTITLISWSFTELVRTFEQGTPKPIAVMFDPNILRIAGGASINKLEFQGSDKLLLEGFSETRINAFLAGNISETPLLGMRLGFTLQDINHDNNGITLDLANAPSGVAYFRFAANDQASNGDAFTINNAKNNLTVQLSVPASMDGDDLVVNLSNGADTKSNLLNVVIDHPAGNSYEIDANGYETLAVRTATAPQAIKRLSMDQSVATAQKLFIFGDQPLTLGEKAGLSNMLDNIDASLMVVSESSNGLIMHANNSLTLTGNQEIQGSPGKDIMYSGPDNDTIVSNGGNDAIYPGTGNDDITLGQTGRQTVFLGFSGESNVVFIHEFSRKKVLLEGGASICLNGNCHKIYDEKMPLLTFRRENWNDVANNDLTSTKADLTEDVTWWRTRLADVTSSIDLSTQDVHMIRLGGNGTTFASAIGDIQIGVAPNSKVLVAFYSQGFQTATFGWVDASGGVSNAIDKNDTFHPIASAHMSHSTFFNDFTSNSFEIIDGTYW